MEFDKPVVLPADVGTIMSSYPFGRVLECKNLGGIPNTTYKVVGESKTVAVRIYSHGQSSLEHIRLELRVLQHLAGKGFESPRPLAGKNGELLQQWKGYWVCASEFIPGAMADTVELTSDLVGDVGRIVASLQKAMESLEMGKIPQGETFIEKGDAVLKSLRPALQTKGLSIDVHKITSQWERAREPFLRSGSKLRHGIIHADIWPPNVICDGERVVGLVDFDDCCYGATCIDVALALMEFSMFQDAYMDQELAVAFLGGYFRNGGTLSSLEEEFFINAMEMACAMWLVYEVIEAPSFVEGEVYLRRLDQLRDDVLRTEMRASIEKCVEAARAMLN